MNSNSKKESQSNDKENIAFLHRDFDQCFEQMRHYDSQILDICKFAFTAYTALAGAAVAFYKFSIDKSVDLVPAAALAVAIGLMLGLLFFILIIRNRIYYVYVARYINEHRQMFLSEKPLGFQNKSGIYMDPTNPPFFGRWSSQLLVGYLVAILNSTLLSILLFFLIHPNTRLWCIIGSSALALFIVQFLLAFCWLRYCEEKTADEAVFTNNH